MSENVLPSTPSATTPQPILGSGGSAVAPSGVMSSSAPVAGTPGSVMGGTAEAVTPLPILSPWGVVDYLATFVIEGDSRSSLVSSVGGAPTSSPWADQLRASLPSLGATNYVNAAVAGQTVATMVGQYAAEIEPYETTAGTFILMAGINDRALSSATTIATNIQTILTNAQSGFGQVFGTLENIRNMGSGLVLGQANNALLAAQASSPICKAFIAPHILLPEAADFLSGDELHPSVAGNSKLKTAIKKHITENPEGVTAADPVSIAGCRMAVDISNLSLIKSSTGAQCSDGDSVHTWEDRSGNGNHLNSTLSTRPTFSNSALLKVTFNANTIATTVNITQSSPFTAYILYEDNKNAGPASTLWSDNRSFVITPRIQSLFGLLMMGTGPGNTAGYTVNSNSISHRVVVCMVYDGTTGRVYMDGKLIWTGTIDACATAARTVLGGLGATANLGLLGSIGGFALFNGAHSVATARPIMKWYSDLGKTYFYPFAT